MAQEAIQDVTHEPRKGRPRSGRLHQAILKTAFNLVLDVGFRAVSIEAIAAKIGVGKTTIYRRWPNKAAVIMDAFTLKVGSGSLFPKADTVTESIRLQMRAMARSFRGSDGALVKALLAEAQFDRELAKAFRERWTLPRRKLARSVRTTGRVRLALLGGFRHARPQGDGGDAGWVTALRYPADSASILDILAEILGRRRESA